MSRLGYNLSPCFIDHFSLVSDFRQLSFFYHYCLCIWNFHCLKHRNEFVKKTVMIRRIHPFFSDMILVMFLYCSQLPWSRAFVGINNTSILCLAFPNTAVGFSTVLYRYFARHCCWYRNIQLAPSGFHYELQLFIVWFDEVYSTQ